MYLHVHYITRTSVTSYGQRDVRHVCHRYGDMLDMRTVIRAADWFARKHDITGGWKVSLAGGAVKLEFSTRANVFVL